MQKRHKDPIRYFNEQVYTTEKFVIPFIEQVKPLDESLRIFELGCGEGGNLKPFVDRGCPCVGVDLNASKIEKGKVLFQNQAGIELICRDIYDLPESIGKFDVLMIRDVIEHIHVQDRFLGFIKQFLNPGAVVFVGFPPWQNPFGGHQQICKSKVLSVCPYFHLLPAVLYRGILRLFGETKQSVDSLLEIKETGISLETFEKYCANNQYVIKKRDLYFINPNYEIKFGLKPRKIFKTLQQIRYLRNFYITCGYYLIVISS